MARNWVDISSIYGGNFAGKALTRLTVETDKKLRLTDWKSTSFWATVISAVGVPLVELFFRGGRLDVLDLALLAFGGQMATNLVDYLEKYLPSSYTEYIPLSFPEPEEPVKTVKPPQFR